MPYFVFAFGYCKSFPFIYFFVQFTMRNTCWIWCTRRFRWISIQYLPNSSIFWWYIQMQRENQTFFWRVTFFDYLFQFQEWKETMKNSFRNKAEKTLWQKFPFPERCSSLQTPNKSTKLFLYSIKSVFNSFKNIPN